ncbi:MULTISPECIES: hypothetical protein [Amycolatopsis]|uniref:Uncharacterized protein n=2 Tax=Amycolatopsis TaxID=1813 RepID=A0A1I4BY42_9PSEU|nr:hypothetical protein [Amycolatopsis sacchari]SFK73692.1 hypothetical protein SAMN05421835_13128 [Amycolatopsis sacchari]
MAAVNSLRREQVVAALLVTGVVVVVGYASGLGLHTTTTATAPAQAGTAQPGADAAMPPAAAGLPQAVAPPGMTMPDNVLPAAGAVSPVLDQPVPAGPAPDGSMPSSPVQVPVAPAPPGQPTPPSQPGAPGSPGTPPAAPAVCLPGAAQTVVDNANTVVSGLPVVSSLTGALGLTQSPDGTSPGALNTLLYTVTGYCDPAGTAAGDPVSALTGALPGLPSVLPAATGG